MVHATAETRLCEMLLHLGGGHVHILNDHGAVAGGRLPNALVHLCDAGSTGWGPAKGDTACTGGNDMLCGTDNRSGPRTVCDIMAQRSGAATAADAALGCCGTGLHDQSNAAHLTPLVANELGGRAAYPLLPDEASLDCIAKH